jgi:hypothetical protein
MTLAANMVCRLNILKLFCALIFLSKIAKKVFIILQDLSYAHYYVKIMWTFKNAQITTPIYKYDTVTIFSMFCLVCPPTAKT